MLLISVALIAEDVSLCLFGFVFNPEGTKQACKLEKSSFFLFVFSPCILSNNLKQR